MRVDARLRSGSEKGWQGGASSLSQHLSTHPNGWPFDLGPSQHKLSYALTLDQVIKEFRLVFNSEHSYSLQQNLVNRRGVDIGGAQLYIEVSSTRDTQGTFRAHPCAVAVQLKLLVKDNTSQDGEGEGRGGEQR